MLGTKSVMGTITDITNRLDVETLHEVGVRELHLNEIGRVAVSLSHPVACEPYADSRDLGGFILVDRLTKGTVGAGMITDIRSGRTNVYLHHLDVDKQARAGLKHQKPAVLWFTGLSGAGKSTISNIVEMQLLALGHHSMTLDGDNVRHGLNRDLGFTEADRVENIRRIAEVAKLFVEAGTIVLVSFISPYRNERMLARECVEAGEFLEIFVDTGVDAPYEEPLDPEIRLRTLESSPEELAAQVIEELRGRGIIA
jgi:bifunctional enzyme CysN/CysC